MRRGETIFDYLSQVMIIFGGTILVLNVFCVWFGEDAKDFSVLFSLGSRGLSVAVTFQFFCVAAIIAGLRFLLFTDRWIKNLSIALRTLCMFTLVFALIVTFILLFDWFPADDVRAWLSFFLCFVFSIVISTGVSVLKEKTENKKMAEALERLKKTKQL